MLNITLSTNAAGSISYYGAAKGELETVGDWQGRDARSLGLYGEVDLADWRKAVRGKGPNGEKLGQKLREDRRCLYDLTFSVEKSTALLLALGDASVREVVKEANRLTMELVEGMVQAKVKGELVTTGSMISAPFYHEITRAREPGYHVHNTLLNATQQEGKWYAVELKPVVEQSGFIRAAFHNEVAKGLVAKGYQIEPTKDNYRVVGIPESACKKLSSRREDINHAQAAQEATLQERIAQASLKELAALETRLTRLKSPKGRAALAVSTRQRKKDLLDPAKLKKEWEAKLTPKELDAIQHCRHQMLDAPVGGVLGKALASMAKAMVEKPKDQEPLEPKLVREAFERFMETDSKVQPEQVLTAALKAGVGRVSLDKLKLEVDKLPALTHKGLLTNPQARQDEADVTDYAQRGLIAWRKEPVQGLPDAAKMSMREVAELTRQADGRILILAGDGRQREGQPLRVLREHGHKPIETLVYKAPKVMPVKGWKEKMRRFMKRLRTQQVPEVQQGVERGRSTGRER